MDNDARHEFFARCASGFEGVLAQELKGMGIRRVRPLKGGVAFFGPASDGYRACLWSRVAARVQLVIARVDARNGDELYRGAVSVPWEHQMRLGATIAVQAHGSNDQLRNTKYTALKVKDAVCDRLREARGHRPDVDPADPDFPIDVSLHAAKATLYLNLSGPLHKRGYREEGVGTEAPLKETLAAGMLLAAGWPKIAAGGGSFADPMCGSGSLAIEAALMATDRAPGLQRTRWGFQGWAHHDDSLWESIVEDAKNRCAEKAPLGRIVAGDVDARAVQVARMNAERAGVASAIEFHVSDAAKLGSYLLGRKAHGLPPTGLLATNPPYGHRLSPAEGLSQTYSALSQALDALPDGWRAAIITPDPSIDIALGLRPGTVIPTYNGGIEVGVRLYDDLSSEAFKLAVVSLAGTERTVRVAEHNSAQFAARLRKVAKERAKWARKAGVSSYRIYDSDLPDYAVSVDLYGGAGPDEGERFLRIAEYKAPATVDADLANRRLADALAIAPAVLDVQPSHVFSKVRRRDKGGGQYRDARDASRVAYTSEAGFLLEIDLAGYLDTGLFLDHRTTRELVGSMAGGKRFLNLFAYTGTATVHAAGGGAAQTTTVDLSQTYLAWARRNMELNGFVGREHRFERADTIPWLERQAAARREYDLVFCDPPTFSNSKAMGQRTFDVQRDHVDLLWAVGEVLAPDGTIVFSCNRRNFKLDGEALRSFGLVAEDITAQTIPHDFSRTPKVHRCYLIRWAR